MRLRQSFPGGDIAMQVYVSYSEKDREQASPILSRLRSEGFDVVDRDSLLLGERRSRVNRLIHGAKAMVVLWSGASPDSSQRRELSSQRHRPDPHILIPVTLDGTDLPGDLRKLVSIDLSRSWEAGMARVLDALRDRGQPSEPEESGDPAGERKHLRNLWFGAFLMVILLVFTLALGSRLDDPSRTDVLKYAYFIVLTLTASTVSYILFTISESSGEVKGSWRGVTIRAGGAFAAFTLVLFLGVYFTSGGTSSDDPMATPPAPIEVPENGDVLHEIWKTITDFLGGEDAAGKPQVSPVTPPLPTPGTTAELSRKTLCALDSDEGMLSSDAEFSAIALGLSWFEVGTDLERTDISVFCGTLEEACETGAIKRGAICKVDLESASSFVGFRELRYSIQPESDNFRKYVIEGARAWAATFWEARALMVDDGMTKVYRDAWVVTQHRFSSGTVEGTPDFADAFLQEIAVAAGDAKASLDKIVVRRGWTVGERSSDDGKENSSAHSSTP